MNFFANEVSLNEVSPNKIKFYPKKKVSQKRKKKVSLKKKKFRQKRQKKSFVKKKSLKRGKKNKPDSWRLYLPNRSLAQPMS